jgi:tight adherence protein B
MMQKMAIGALFFSFALIAYLVIGICDRVITRYKATYVQSVNMNLRTLFLLLRSEDIFALGVILGIGGGALAFILFSGSYIISGITAVFFFCLPTTYLRWARRKRNTMLVVQLVDGLSLISNAMRAGQSLPQAFRLVNEEMSEPISQEFGILIKEYDLGTPIERCLMNMSNRLMIDEVELFVNSVVICSSSGGNLTETFGNISSMIRERKRLEGKIQSLTAEGRTQGLVLTLMPVLIALAFYWLNPTMIRFLFDTTAGGVILFIIVALDLSAWFVTRRIMDIDI